MVYCCIYTYYVKYIQYLDDALLWWKKHHESYPTLAILAKKLLCIPATSAPAEIAFSAAGNIVTDKRNRLCETSIRELMFLHFNMELPPPKPSLQEAVTLVEKASSIIDGKFNVMNNIC